MNPVLATYPMIIIPFMIITLIVTLISSLRANFGRRLLGSTIAALVLCVLTAVFDNLMIAAGLFDYPSTQISGIKIGLAPIEDFAYPVCAAYGLPAVFVLLPQSHHRQARQQQVRRR